MADYCDAASVQKLMKWFTFDASSKVTLDELNNEFIPESTVVINSKLERVYVTPITDPDDVEILQYIACRMVACEIAHVLILQADGEISDIVNRWCEQAKQKLDDILNQVIRLPGSTLLASDGRLYSFTAHGNDKYEAPDPEWYLNASETKVNQW